MNGILEFFRRKNTKWVQDDFFRHAGVMIIGTGLANLFNLLYQLGLVRLLSVVEYGILNSLIAIMTVLSQLTVPLRPALTKFLATSFARNETGQTRLLLRRSTRDLGLISFGILLVFILGSGPLADWQQIESRSLIILIGFIATASTMAIVPGAFLWGAQRFKYLACFSVLPTFLKLAVGMGLVWFGLGVKGALGGYLINPLAMLLLGFFLIRASGIHFSKKERAEPAVSMAPIYRYFIPTSIILFSFAILTNVDVILVKHFFPPREAGFYSVAQMVGKIILFLPGAVAIVVFPKAASARARNAASFPLLQKGLLIVTFFNVLGVLICGLFPRTVLEILTAKNDPESVQLVLWFALVMSFYALSMLVIFYHLAVHNTKIVLPLVILATAEVVTICLCHPSLLAVLFILLSYSIATFCVSLFVLRYTFKNRDPNALREFVESAEIKNSGHS